MIVTVTYETFHALQCVAESYRECGESMQFVRIIEDTALDYDVENRTFSSDHLITIHVPNDEHHVDGVTSLVYALAEIACVRITW